MLANEERYAHTLRQSFLMKKKNTVIDQQFIGVQMSRKFIMDQPNKTLYEFTVKLMK